MDHCGPKHVAFKVLKHYFTSNEVCAFVGLQCNKKGDLNVKSGSLAIKIMTQN